MTHFGSLDGVRCLCIIAVVYHHTFRIDLPLPMFRRGFLGVDMFFVLSGFLIVTLILRERDRSGLFSLRNFFVRRTLRIFPIYFAIILALAAVAIVRGSGKIHDSFLPALPYFLTYTYNWYPKPTFFAVAWSLCVEEQFYVFWPPIEKFFKRGRTLVVLTIFLAVNQLVNFGLLDAFFEEHLGTSDLSVLDATFTPVCLGVFLAHFLHSPKSFGRLYRVFGSRHSWIWVSLVAFLVVNLPGADISGWRRLAIQMSMTGFLASLVIRESCSLMPLLTLYPVKRIGMISYGIYLYHVLAKHVASSLLAPFDLGKQGFALLVLTLALTIIVSEISFRFFELPIIRLKEKLQVRRPSATGRVLTKTKPVQM
ncbi:MAG: acyltransferase [Planctomycetota bacterium]